MVTYPALFEPAREGGYVVKFPDFAWGVTQGDDEREALEMAVDALRILLAEQIKDGAKIPAPSKHRGRSYRMVSLPVLQSAKVELYKAFRSSGIRKSELAERLGLAKSNIDRLFDLNHASRMDQIEAAFRVLNKRLLVTVANAA